MAGRPVTVLDLPGYPRTKAAELLASAVTGSAALVTPAARPKP
jgi:hypothetical protein